MATEATARTIGYYESHAQQFSGDTLEVEFSEFQDAFLGMLPERPRVLDLGCGSGRDGRAFALRGCDVVAVDGSASLCEIAEKVIGKPVTCALFDEYEPEGMFDGVWACSSLLHVAKAELPALIAKYAEHLVADGVFYLSFKYGDFEGVRNGRWFTDLDEAGIDEVLAKVPQLQIAKLSTSGDVRPGRQQERWLNVFCRRVVG